MAKLELPGYPKGVAVPQPPFFQQVRPAQKNVMDVVADVLDEMGDKLFNDESTQRINGRYAAGQAVAHSQAFLHDWNERYSGKEEDRAAKLQEAIQGQMGAVHQLALEMGGVGGVVLEDVYTSRMFTVIDQTIDTAHKKIAAAQDAKIGLVRDELVRQALLLPFDVKTGMAASPEAFQEVADHFEDLTRGEHPKMSVAEARVALTGTYRLIAERRVRQAIAANPDKWLTQLIEGEANSVLLPVFNDQFQNTGTYTYAFDGKQLKSFVAYAGTMTDAYRIQGAAEDAQHRADYREGGKPTVQALAIKVFGLAGTFADNPTEANKAAALAGIKEAEDDFNEMANDPNLVRALGIEANTISTMNTIFAQTREEVYSGRGIRGSRQVINEMKKRISGAVSLTAKMSIKKELSDPDFLKKVGSSGLLELQETLNVALGTDYPELLKSVVEMAGQLTDRLGPRGEPGLEGERKKLPAGALTSFQRSLHGELHSLMGHPEFFKRNTTRGAIAQAISAKVGEVAEKYATELKDGNDFLEGQLSNLLDTYKQSAEVIEKGMPFDAWLFQYVDSSGQPFSEEQLLRLLNRYEIWKARGKDLERDRIEQMKAWDAKEGNGAPSKYPTLEEKRAAYGDVPVYPGERTRLGEYQVDKESYMTEMRTELGEEAFGMFVNVGDHSEEQLADAFNVFLGGEYIEPGDITIKNHALTWTMQDPRSGQQYAVVSIDAVLEGTAYKRLHPGDQGRLHAKLSAFSKAVAAERQSRDKIKSWEQHAGGYFDETIQKAEQQAMETKKGQVDAYIKARNKKLEELNSGQDQKTKDTVEKQNLMRLKLEQLSGVERDEYNFTFHPDPDNPETFYDQAKGVVGAVGVLQADAGSFEGVKQYVRFGTIVKNVSPAVSKAIKLTAGVAGYNYLHESRLRGGKIAALIATNKYEAGSAASQAAKKKIEKILHSGEIHKLPQLLMDYMNQFHGDLLQKGKEFAGLSVSQLEKELGEYVEGNIETVTERYKHIYDRGWERDPDNRDNFPVDYTKPRGKQPSPAMADFSHNERKMMREFFDEKVAYEADKVRSAAQVIQDNMREASMRSVGGRDE